MSVYIVIADSTVGNVEFPHRNLVVLSLSADGISDRFEHGFKRTVEMKQHAC